jgi:hypothetical protein
VTIRGHPQARPPGRVRVPAPDDRKHA